MERAHEGIEIFIGSRSVKTLIWVSVWHIQGRRKEAAMLNQRRRRRESGEAESKSDGPAFRCITNVKEAVVGIIEITCSDLGASREFKCLNRTI